MKGGFVSIYKPLGVSSFKALSGVKKFFDTRKVGHMGTLDPLAEGVLPVAVDEATKLIQYVEKEPKEYVVEIYFGQNSETLDREGLDLDNLEVIDQSFSEEDFLNALVGFVGKIEQVPPKYSAVKIDGKRAYDLARADEEFEISKRKVELFSFELVEFNWPMVKLKIKCGSGFYVRSLVRDLCQVLSVPGFMYSLVRTQVGPFNLDNSSDVDSLSTVDESQILKNFVRTDLNESELELIRNGMPIASELNGLVYGYFEGKLCSVLFGSDGFLKVTKNLKL